MGRFTFIPKARKIQLFVGLPQCVIPHYNLPSLIQQETLSSGIHSQSDVLNNTFPVIRLYSFKQSGVVVVGWQPVECRVPAGCLWADEFEESLQISV